MKAIPTYPPVEDIYYPPVFPKDPPHQYVQLSQLTTASCSAVDYITESGVPDIRAYLQYTQAIDITQARNPIEIRVFRRIRTIEGLCSFARVPQVAQHRIYLCFDARAAEMNARMRQQRANEPEGTGHFEETTPDFWTLFHFMYRKDMQSFRMRLLQMDPQLLYGIDWDFMLCDESSDVCVMVYLWMLSLWHTQQRYAMMSSSLLKLLAGQLRILLPNRHDFSTQSAG